MNETVYRFIVESDGRSLLKLREQLSEDIVQAIKKLAEKEVERIFKKEKI
jgi:hypothetical protein